MEKIYTEQFAKETIEIIVGELQDLSKWSVYNDDICNEEINEIENQLQKIQERLDNG